MKNIKDYLHLYLLADVLVQGEERTGRLTGTMNGNYECEIQFRLVDNPHHSEEEPESANTDDVKLCLRPLSDMTEEEKNQFERMVEDAQDFNKPEAWTDNFVCEIAEHTRYLLSKHFDLFGLIESGLAIDKTTL